MAKPRQLGAETSETRSLLLNVTEKVILEDGYAAVTSRRISKEAGVTPALVHYYFGTLDDLFAEVLRRRAEQQLERQRRILEDSPTPLRALWDAINDPAWSGMTLEFMALANHRKAIRSQLAAYVEEFRKMQLDVLQDHIAQLEIDADEVPPVSIPVLINAIATTTVLERSIGMETGLDETKALVERYLDRLEGRGD